MKTGQLNKIKLLSTADVMQAAGVGRETLRFYEDQGLIRPLTRTAAGYRQFAPDVVDLIGFIKKTQQAGFSLKEIHELLQLRTTAENTCNNVNGLLDNKRRLIDEELAACQRKREVIDAMIGDCCAVNDCKPTSTL